MISKAIVSALVALSLTAGEFAAAQGRGDRHARARDEQAPRAERDQRADRAQRGGRDERGPPGAWRGGRDDAARGHDRRAYPERGAYYGRYDRHARHGQRGAGPNHSFYRGERLPYEYRSRYYVIDDWRGHRLSAPPRGTHWVQTGADYVLVAIATGVIVQLLLNH